MKRIVLGPDVADFVSVMVGTDTFSDPYIAMGVEVDGKIIGGVVFNNWTGHNVDVSVAGEPRAWTPIFFRRLAEYAWDELGVLRVSIVTRAGNPAVENICRRMGATYEGPAVNWFGERQDGLRYAILRDNWKLTR